jgi:phosphonate transport system substrate-binding protein
LRRIEAADIGHHAPGEKKLARAARTEGSRSMTAADSLGANGRSSARELIFACDVNLGFPTDDPEWAAFFRDHGWRTVNYDEMGELTATLKAHQPSAAFMPAANYYYLKDDPFYAGLASARAERSGGTTVTSVLIVPQTSDAHSVLDLRGKRLGHINSYCTTSYFSPAILLAEHDVPFGTFFSTVEPVGAWQHQIDAVAAGRVDATMVEKGIWLDKPANAAATKIIGSVDRLPGPVIVLATSVAPAFASAFLTKLLACRTAAPAQPFLGYTGYCTDVVQAFFDRSERAFGVAAS